MKRRFYSTILIFIIGFSLGMGFIFEGLIGQQKLIPAQQIQQLRQQLQNSNFLLATEKQDTEKLILEKAGKQNTINQLNNKLLQTQNILKGLIKDEKIKLKLLDPLIRIGYNFGPGPELPSSMPADSTDSGDIRPQ